MLWFGFGLSVSHNGSCLESLVSSMVMLKSDLERGLGHGAGRCFSPKGFIWFSQDPGWFQWWWVVRKTVSLAPEHLRFPVLHQGLFWMHSCHCDTTYYKALTRGWTDKITWSWAGSLQNCELTKPFFFLLPIQGHQLRSRGHETWTPVSDLKSSLKGKVCFSLPWLLVLSPVTEIAYRTERSGSHVTQRKSEEISPSLQEKDKERLNEWQGYCGWDPAIGWDTGLDSWWLRVINVKSLGLAYNPWTWKPGWESLCVKWTLRQRRPLTFRISVHHGQRRPWSREWGQLRNSTIHS